MARVKVVQPRVSYADLERAPEDGRRYELYDGEVFVVPAPLPRHQVSQQLVLEVLRGYAAQHGGFVVTSPIDIVFSDYDVLQPDVVFFRRERQHLIDLDSPIRDVPDLCVEVLSPSTAAADRGRKMQMFARYGVPGTGSSIQLRGRSRCTASCTRLTSSRAWRGAATCPANDRRAGVRCGDVFVD